MNAFQLLKNDHQIVSGLFDQIESSSGQAKTQLFSRLKSELDVHALIEEKVFYPALENKKESREITLEAYEEHKVVKDLLAELAAGSSADEEWDAKLKVLRENVEHHVEEEEGELFDKANDVLSDEDLERLGEEMEAEKARQLGTTPPRATKRGAAKSAGSRRKGSPGVLSRLASFVGLGGSKESTKGTAKGGKKKAAKASKKSSSKAAAKKSGAKKSVKSKKAASKSTKGGRGRGAGSSASKGASKKSTKSSGATKRKTGGSKKR
jgi:hypothetical protein